MKNKNSKIGLHKLILILFAMFVFGLLILTQNWFGNIKPKSISVLGNELIQNNEIVNLIASDTNKIFNDLDLKVLEEKVESHPFVLNATLSKDALGNLEILVTERFPFAMLSANNLNQIKYVSNDGVVIPHRLLNKSIDVPIINCKNNSINIENNFKINNPIVLNALKFLEFSKSGNRTLYFNISEITIDKNGNYIVFTNQKAIPVLIGKHNFHSKAEILNSFLTQFPIEYDSSQTKYIDARFSDQIILGTQNLYF